MAVLKDLIKEVLIVKGESVKDVMEPDFVQYVKVKVGIRMVLQVLFMIVLNVLEMGCVRFVMEKDISGKDLEYNSIMI